MKRPTDLRRLDMWQSRRVQDIALYLTCLIALAAMVVW